VPVMGGASEADSIYLVLNEPVKLVIMILSCTLTQPFRQAVLYG
jgi:hypothetical protein